MIHEKIEPKARFKNTLSQIKTAVTELFKANDTITSLLWFDTPDALNKVGEIDDAIISNVYRQSSDQKKLFLFAYDREGAGISESAAQIHLSFDSVKPLFASKVKVPYLLIQIIVANSNIVLEDGLSQRHDILFQEVCDTIEGHAVGAVGTVELELAEETVLRDNTHTIWSATFKAGELRL